LENFFLDLIIRLIEAVQAMPIASTNTNSLNQNPLMTASCAGSASGCIIIEPSLQKRFGMAALSSPELGVFSLYTAFSLVSACDPVTVPTPLLPGGH
jgi:hypothetical protein